MKKKKAPDRICHSCKVRMVCVIGNRQGAAFRKYYCPKCKRTEEESRDLTR
jgi:hypothetical protein